MRRPTVVAQAGRIEWPTVLLALVIHGGWATLTYVHDRLPLGLTCAAGAWLVAWHGSLQHEILHGHPTRSRRFNRLLALAPLNLWLPFDVYRATHLCHHRDETLTDPLDDPESRYLTPQAWARIGPLGRSLLKAQRTVLGRLAIGPAWAIGRFLLGQVRDVLEGRDAARRTWLLHLPLAAVVLGWLVLVCRFDLVTYVVGIVYPATGLMLLRSFAEHKAAPDIAERTAIVENAPVLGLLYLYNNLHVVHHARPNLAWYVIPSFYRANRAALIGVNGGLVYDGYAEILRRFAFRPYETVVHPLLGRDEVQAALQPISDRMPSSVSTT